MPLLGPQAAGCPETTAEMPLLGPQAADWPETTAEMPLLGLQAAGWPERTAEVPLLRHGRRVLHCPESPKPWAEIRLAEPSEHYLNKKCALK